jgi:regulator of replication initiation timing
MHKYNADKIDVLENNIIGYRDSLKTVELKTGELVSYKQSLILNNDALRKELNMSKKEINELEKTLNSKISQISKLNAMLNVKDTIYDTIYKVTCEIAGGYDHQQRMDAQADLVAFFPDEGAMKRYSDMANMPYAFGIKKRNWETGKILGLDIMNTELVKDKNVLIIDDICSRGGTFLHSAKALKAAGANRIFLYVTHAEKTMVNGEMYNDLDLVERIYTTDSIFNIEWDDRNKVTIVNEF